MSNFQGMATDPDLPVPQALSLEPSCAPRTPPPPHSRPYSQSAVVVPVSYIPLLSFFFFGAEGTKGFSELPSPTLRGSRTELTPLHSCKNQQIPGQALSRVLGRGGRERDMVGEGCGPGHKDLTGRSVPGKSCI